ncbi:MAG: peptidylprolyl isomerase [Bdellovibrionales bacterium]|nr:peptidylprolyl isomerase [Bdellovibrionales bacterium]
MMIQENCVVSFHYVLKNKAGEILDSSQGAEPLSYLHGKKNIILGLEKELEGKQPSDEFNVAIPPAEAYGERQDALITKVSKQELAEVEDLEVGVQLQAQTNQGTQVFTVIEMEGDSVTLDGNNPLAGEELHFEVKVESVREATDMEISDGRAHSSGEVSH